MENLALTSVVRALDAHCGGRALADVRQDAAHRLRLLFADGARSRTVLVGLLPELPWVGRPAAPPIGRAALGAFAGTVRRALCGVPLVAVRQPGLERIARFDFADGQALVAELRPRAPNVALLDAAGVVRATWRRPPPSAERLAIGGVWSPPEPPAGRPDPRVAPLAVVQAALDAGRRAGESLEQSLVRRLFGIGPLASTLVAREAGNSGRDPAEVLRGRLAALAAGSAAAVAERPSNALAGAEQGTLDVDACRLWPWAPADEPPPDVERVDAPDAAAAAGCCHEPAERAILFRRRASALGVLVAKEAARLRAAELRARADLAGFADPAGLRRQAEALLASGGRARRTIDGWAVPDPYDPAGRTLLVPVDGGATLHATADALFRRHRRACRGLARARARAGELAARAGRLVALARAFDERPDAAALDALETALRELGVPVALEAAALRRRAGAAVAAPRLEGVRLFTSGDGLSILAGRTARDNDRLTFKLSAPEDFWFHARDCAGAHVVVRNDARRKTPPDATLHEAAAVAAWFSEQRGEARVDVQWTQRKHVRRVRGGSAGTVLVKRAVVVRVAPGLPGDIPL